MVCVLEMHKSISLKEWDFFCQATVSHRVIVVASYLKYHNLVQTLSQKF